MEKKLTAVQWLIENAKGFHNAESSKAMQEEALRMEKKQIEEAYKQGQYDSPPIRETDAAQYYNQTYNQNK